MLPGQGLRFCAHAGFCSVPQQKHIAAPEQTAAEEAKREVEQAGERLLTAESERDALVQALKEQQDSKDVKQEVPVQ
jgi:hypothetical protein